MTTPTPHPWLDHAWVDLGCAAAPGPATEPHVQAYYAAAGHPEVEGDETAWCAAFVGACLAHAGIAPTGSLMARSYLRFGAAISEARPGAIAVFSRGSDPALGHVAFVVGQTSDALLVLGGNQSNAVTVMAMPRSRLLALRWPVAPASTASNPPDRAEVPDPIFARALAHVLAMEGGYTNDAYDPGGPTNLGLTRIDVAGYRGTPLTEANAATLEAAVKALTPADAAPMYQALYWQPCSAPQLPPAIALFHFDASVNHGLGGAARMLQQALAVDVDGDIGPETLAAAATRDASALLATYAEIRRDRYRGLSTFWRFGRGWLARVDKTLAAATDLLGASVPHSAHNPHHQPQKDHAMTEATQAAPSTSATSEPKWWGQSLTIWGTIITTLSTVLPVVGPLVGLDISADTIRQLGDGVVHVAQAFGGVLGIVLTIYGRTRASQPLMRRDVMVRL